MNLHVPFSLSNRRVFLKQAAAAATLASSPSSRWPAFASTPTTTLEPLPKNPLVSTFGPLAASLLPLPDWHPCAKPGEPDWSSIPQPVLQAILKRADIVQSTPWLEMLATDELEFKRNGNRTRFESISFGRRNRLADLVLAECASNQGKYLDQIANGVWLICEESFWGVPAHLGAQKAGVGLADISEPIIELFGAETCATLAWVVYLLGPQLNSVSPRILERVHLEAKRRILDPYATRNDFGWMGLDGKNSPLNNWNPWINSNVLTANLLLEKDPQRRQGVLQKICRSVDQFLAQYSPDGACEEGPGYWGRSAASFFDCCSTLVSAHSGKGDAILTHPFTRAMGHYICSVHIAGNDYVNYGDAHIHDAPPPDLAYRFGRATHDDMLAQFGAFDAKQHGLALGAANRNGVASLSRELAAVMVARELTTAPSHDALPRDAWYPHLGLMTARRAQGSAAGFYLAAQAASNGRSHGHNDSGSFIVFHNGAPIFIDVGPEAYTAKTFSKDRYTLWTMQSAFHNLPTINGVMQHDGNQYRASDLHYECDDTKALFRANLATAYPKEAGAQRWTRTLTLDRAQNIVTIEEDFALQKPAELFLSLMCCTEPAIHAESVTVGTASLHFDPQDLAVTCETIPLTDDNLKHSWGDAVYRLKLTSTHPTAKSIYKLELRAT